LTDIDWLGVGVSMLLSGSIGIPLVRWAIRWSEADDIDEQVAEAMNDLDAEYAVLVDEAAAFEEVQAILGPPPCCSALSDDDLLLIALIVGVRGD
jgi:hypothetical protein